MSKQVEQERAALDPSELGHVDQASPEHTPGYVLLPGDPNRVNLMRTQWDAGAEMRELSRAQQSAVGTYRGAELGAWSTGVGGPSAECVLTDLAARGTHTFIRVGTTGAIQDDIHIGDIIINDSNVRLDGTSRLYVRDEYPAAASYEVVAALVQACENLGLRYHVGTGLHLRLLLLPASVAPPMAATAPPGWTICSQDLRRANVLNFEMEGRHGDDPGAAFFGKAAGPCGASVVAHRLTGEGDETADGERNACLAGAEAIRILTEWDGKKAAAGKRYFFPGL